MTCLHSRKGQVKSTTEEFCRRVLPIHKTETKVVDFSASGNESHDLTVISKGNTTLFKKKTEGKGLPDVTAVLETL